MELKLNSKVKVRNLEWYDSSRDSDGTVRRGREEFTPEMAVFCGKEATVITVFPANDNAVMIDIDDANFYYSWMFEPETEAASDRPETGTAEAPASEADQSGSSGSADLLPRGTYRIGDDCKAVIVEGRVMIIPSRLFVLRTGESLYLSDRMPERKEYGWMTSGMLPLPPYLYPSLPSDQYMEVDEYMHDVSKTSSSESSDNFSSAL